MSGPRSAVSLHGWMLVTVLAIAIHGLFLRDRIPVSYGLGYDGATYGLVALQPEHIYELPFNRVQRCLPSLLVHVVIRSLGLPLTTGSVITLFSLLNAALLMAGLWVWLRIGSLLGLGTTSLVLGFCGLFVSFAGATMPYYYPVLTDTAGLFLGLLGVWLFLVRSMLGLLAVLVVTGLAWPSLMWFLIPLIAFPATRTGLGPDAAVPPASDPRRRLAAFAVSLGLLAMAAAAWALPHAGWPEPMEAALPLSFVALGAYVTLGSLPLLVAGSELAGDWKEGLWGAARRGGLAVAICMAQQLVLGSVFTKPAQPIQTPSGLLVFMLKSSIASPGSFLVGHAANFGILFLLVVAFWGDVVRIAARFGLGAWLFLGATFAFSINSESRHSNAFWPMALTFVCIVLDRYPLRRWWVVLFCALSFLNSRTWMVFNARFPELYFANFALTMTASWYFVQSAFFAGIAAYLHLSWDKAISPADQTSLELARGADA